MRNNHLSIGILCSFFAYSEFDKNASSGSVGIRDSFSAELVWRLPEFAFFGAPTSVGAPFYFHGLFLPKAKEEFYRMERTNMKDFQQILAQIAKEHGTTPEEVLREMQAAIDTAYASPTAEQKNIQDAIPAQGDRPTPEELVSHLASLFGGNLH